MVVQRVMECVLVSPCNIARGLSHFQGPADLGQEKTAQTRGDITPNLTCGCFNREVVAEVGMDFSDDSSGSVTVKWSEHEKKGAVCSHI